MPAAIVTRGENPRETASVLALLSQLWAAEVDSQTLASLAKPPLAAAWKDFGGHVPADISRDLVDELAVDYCQLLIGPRGHVSPVQSVHDQARFSGDATGSMQKYIGMLSGFKPCVELVDHVAVQLQYASALFSLAEQSKRSLVQGLVQAFTRDHLEWTRDFFPRIESQAQTEFYRGLAVVSHKFLFSV